MANSKTKLASIDPVWDRVRSEAAEMVQAEPLLGGLVHSSLLHHATMERALAYRFSLKLASGEMSEQILREIADEAYDADAGLGAAARADLTAVFDRDPACLRFIQPMLFFKGYQAVQAYRVGHWLWGQGRRDAGLADRPAGSCPGRRDRGNPARPQRRSRRGRQRLRSR